MAPYLKWLLLLVLALAVTAFLVASIDQSRFVESRRLPPERAHAQALANEEAKVQLELAQIMRRDSLLALLPPTGPPLYRAHPDLKSDSAGAVSTPVMSELRGLSEPRARIGVFIVDEAYGSYRSTATPDHNVEFFAGTDSAGPYCMVAGLAHRTRYNGRLYAHEGPLWFGFGRDPYFWTNWGPSMVLVNHVLGPCVFWGRYGKPGPHIDAWLNVGGYYFANAPAPWLALPDNRHKTRAELEEQGIPWFDNENLRARGCRAGRQAECLKLALAPWPPAHARARSPVATFVSYRGETVVFGKGDAAMLAHLEQEFGRERFQRFWQSPAPVEAAFESAFGIAMDQWVTQWVQKYLGAEAAGPGLEVSNFALSLLTIAMLLALSIRLGQKRTVGGDDS